jgi:hypothetical protein
MEPKLIWVGVICCSGGWLIGMVIGFFLFSMMKISSDENRLWKGYFKKLKEEKGESNGN